MHYEPISESRASELLDDGTEFVISQESEFDAPGDVSNRKASEAKHPGGLEPAPALLSVTSAAGALIFIE